MITFINMTSLDVFYTRYGSEKKKTFDIIDIVIALKNVCISDVTVLATVNSIIFRPFFSVLCVRCMFLTNFGGGGSQKIFCINSIKSCNFEQKHGNAVS